jgi:23S rRNA (uracil1939-C5)-methyltransferase
LAIKDFALKEGLTFFDIRKQNGLLRNLIIRNTTIGELMVLLSFFENNTDAIEKTMVFLKEEFPEITSLLYVINEKKNDTIFDQEIVTYHGKGHIVEKLECMRYQIGPKTFFQTNSAQAAELYAAALKMANFSGNEIVYDLYSGSGTIACFVAGSVNKVIGLEFIPEAIEDAKVNAKKNNINNASFYAGDMKDLLSDEFVKQNGKPHVIITDPPRAGMHKDVVEQIMRMQPEKVVYISCNAATQARDIALMSSIYQVKAIQPVDMFPHTHHVENIALLYKKG